jgi:hypothetical protein
VVRGYQSLRVECAPAFNYALAEHRTLLVPDDSIPAIGKDAPVKQKKAIFESDDLSLDLRFVAESVIDGVPSPFVEFQPFDLKLCGHKGISISADLDLVEGQVVTFVLRTVPKATEGQHNSNPTSDKIPELGVSLDREFCRRRAKRCATLIMEYQNFRAALATSVTEKTRSFPRYVICSLCALLKYR